MSHYKSNLRDIEFNLFEDLGVGEVHCGTNQRRTPDRDWWAGDLTALDALSGGVQ